MYNSDLFKVAKEVLESCDAITKALKILPAEVEIGISLENRIPCTLHVVEGKATLSPRPAKSPDVTYVLFSESIRRLSESRPASLWALGDETTRLVLAESLEIHFHSSAKVLYEKGYFKLIQLLSPAHFKFKMFSHSINSLSSLISIPTEFITKKISKILQK